jgi:Fe2+ transport system protein B
MISGNVAPLARFIMAITSAFLLVPSVLGLLAGFLARDVFLAALAFLAGLRVPLGLAVSDAGLLMLSLSIAFSLIEFLLDRVAVVTVITSMRRHSQVKTPWRLFFVFFATLQE